MKNFIILLIFGVLLGLGLLYCFDKSWDNRCKYYETLPYPTEMMKQCCPNIK